MAEVGRYPTFIILITRLIKYYARVSCMSKSSLVGHALEVMEERSKEGKMSWARAVNYIIDSLGLPKQIIFEHINESEYKKRKTSKNIQSLLEDRYNNFWKHVMDKQTGKLDSFKHIKKHFEYARYLDSVKTRKYQTALTRLRISNHRLNIETGRYKRPVVAREERICDLCHLGVEDEYHFMFQCPTLADVRKEKMGREKFWGSKTYLLHKFLEEFTECRPMNIASYIHEAMIRRHELLSG